MLIAAPGRPIARAEPVGRWAVAPEVAGRGRPCGRVGQRNLIYSGACCGAEHLSFRPRPADLRTAGIAVITASASRQKRRPRRSKFRTGGARRGAEYHSSPARVSPAATSLLTGGAAVPASGCARCRPGRFGCLRAHGVCRPAPRLDNSWACGRAASVGVSVCRIRLFAGDVDLTLAKAPEMWRCLDDGTPDGMEEVARMCGRAAGTRGGRPDRARDQAVSRSVGTGFGRPDGGGRLRVSRQLVDGMLKC